MKKTLFFLLIPFLGFSQWTENFDSGTTMPAGWAVINDGGANEWLFDIPDSGSAQSGDNVATLTYNATAHDDYLITKAIVVTAGVSDRISFYVKSRTSSFLEDYEVLLSTTNQTKPAFTTVLQATQKAPDTWTQKTFSLSSYVGQTVYVAIHATDTDQFEIYADTFKVDALPASPPVCTTFTSPANGAIGVDVNGILNWNSIVSATGYKLKVGTTSGGSDVVNNIDVGDVATYNITGNLTPNTVYYASVTPYNIVGNAIGCSEISFTTMASPANDDCSSAVMLTLGANFAQNAISGSTSASTNTPALTASCLFTPSNVGGNVWYKVVVPASGSLTIETAGVAGSALTDTVLSVFSDCTGATSLGCDDDAGTGAFSKLELTAQTPGTTLYVSVWKFGTSDGGDGAFSISAYDASVLGTNDVSGVKNTLKAYPNPFADVLNISDVKNVKSISVIDIAGRVVKTLDKPSSALQLGELKSGLYVIVLNMNDGSQQTIKAIKK
ncbi:choice-of-anchor J domain-containing protein [Chryseobacterium aahli]|uniref:T9SS-dependent choice-of-anchor J family protein n=1 Tax=Chryseobacterium aahli TaxID=1278643 RepID=UPI001F604927|nr:choice-of-anchor J domain-containing protein [Chryseobacterium aahli]MCI3938667.1 choice-of-anchor J domain-containing protein [Chryseobacterium aahli]